MSGSSMPMPAPALPAEAKAQPPSPVAAAVGGGIVGGSVGIIGASTVTATLLKLATSFPAVSISTSPLLGFV